MTLNDVRVEFTFVKDGHDVVRVSVVLKNTYSVDIYQRNVRDQMRVKFGARSVVAKDMWSFMVKLASD